jgi:prevent-host-death family protein
MPPKRPTTKTKSASEVRQHFAETVNEAAKGISRTVIEKNGVPSAAFVSARDLERLEREDEQWEEDWKVIDEMRAAFADVDPEELERQFAKDLAEVRAEMTREREAALQKQSSVA